MISRYRISLNGNQLDEIDENLLILDISYSPAERNIRKQQTANLDGVSIGQTSLAQRTVTVTFELHIYNTAERNRVCQLVNDWANAGGKLVTNDREGQYLQDVICEQDCDIGSVRDWTAPLTVVLATTSNPYWISEEETILSMTGKSVSGSMELDGNVGSALVGLTVTATGPVTTLQITAGSSTLKLTGLTVSSGQKVAVDYVKNRYMRIRANGSSVMSSLEPSSSDNLSIPCGKVSTISVTARNGNAAANNVTAVFTARGCWR